MENENGIPGRARSRLRVGLRVVQSATLLALESASYHQLPDENDVAQLEQVLRDRCSPVQILYGILQL